MRPLPLKKLLAAAAAILLPAALPAAADAPAPAANSTTAAASNKPTGNTTPAARSTGEPPVPLSAAAAPSTAPRTDAPPAPQDADAANPVADADAPPPPPPRQRPDFRNRPERGARGERFGRGGGNFPPNPAFPGPSASAAFPNPSSAFAAAGTAPPPPPAAAPALNPDDIVGPLYSSNLELRQVVSLFEKLSGKTILAPLLPGVNITVELDERATRAEALFTLEMQLAQNYVALTPIPGTKFYRATYVAGAITEVPPLYTNRADVEKLPPTLSTISRLFVLQHTTAQVLDPALQTLVNRQRNESVLTFPTGNAVLFTSTVQNVQRAEKIVASLDVPNSVLFFKLNFVRPTEVKKYLASLYTGANSLRNVLGGDITIEADDLASHLIVVTTPQNREKIREIVTAMDKNNVELKSFKLNHVRPTEVKRLIQALQGGGTTTTGTARPGYVGGGGGMASPATTAFNNVLGGDFVIEADDNANRLMVVAQPQILERLKKVIEDMDRDSLPKTSSETLSLRHSEASSVFNTLQAIVLGASNNASGGAANRTGATNTATRSATSNARLTGSTSSGSAATRNEYSSYSFSTRKTSTQNVPGAYTWGPGGQVPATITQPGTPNSFSDYLTVTAEDRTNRLIIFGTADDIRQVKEIVAKIDVPLPQVRIEAIIVEVTLSNGEASGLSALGIGYKSGAVTSNTGMNSRYDNPEYTFYASGATAPGATTPPFSITGSLRDFSLSMVFGLAETSSRVRVLSAPNVTATHNQESRISVGERRPYSGSTTYAGNSAYPTTSTEYIDINLELVVLPRISSNGSVEMQVVQSNKSLSGTVNINGNDTPIVAERSSSSTLVARNNETVVLAGLQSYQETHSKGIMWLLGYIPLIGEFFRPESDDIKRTELIVFLRPHIITPDESRVSDSTPGLLPGSLTRIDAKSYIDTGRFSAVSLTEEERAAIEDIRRRQNTNAAATRDEQLRHESSDSPLKPAAAPAP